MGDDQGFNNVENRRIVDRYATNAKKRYLAGEGATLFVGGPGDRVAGSAPNGGNHLGSSLGRGIFPRTFF